VNVTPPTSGAANAHGASPLPAANSSLADFLLANAPANSGQDFRAIAAAMFGVESTTATPAQAIAQGPDAAKKPSVGPQDESEFRKSKESPDPVAGMAHPELTVPLPVLPAPPLDFTPKPGPVTGPVRLLDIKAALKDPAMFAGQNLGDSGEKVADAASSLPSTPSETLKTIMPPPSFTEAGPPAPTVIMGKVQKELPTFGGDKPHLLERPAPPSDLMQTKEPVARLVAPAASITAARKAADDGSGQPPSIETAKPVSTAATHPDRPTPPTHVPIAVNPGLEVSPVTVSLPPAAMVEVIPAASASEIVDKSMSSKLARPSGPVEPSLPAGLTDGAPPTTPVASPTIRGRDVKERGIKDTRTTSTQRVKIASTEVGTLADGLTKSAATSSKDVAGVTLGSHSDTHAQAIPLKQSASTPSFQTPGPQADAPDEALPTSTASPVTTAKLVHDMSHSEFRVGMQTQEFGNIDIRTSVARHMFSAQISVEHSDVAKSMTADLPALYHKLADQQVPVASIVIQGQSFATSSGLAQDSQQPQTWRPQSYNVNGSEVETALPSLMETLDSTGRLDIRI
jgi:flagellar hook-length control protein FliK